MWAYTLQVHQYRAQRPVYAIDVVGSVTHVTPISGLKNKVKPRRN